MNHSSSNSTNKQKRYPTVPYSIYKNRGKSLFYVCWDEHTLNGASTNDNGGIEQTIEIFRGKWDIMGYRIRQKQTR